MYKLLIKTVGATMNKIKYIIAVLTLLAMTACYPFIKDIPEQTILAGAAPIEVAE